MPALGALMDRGAWGPLRSCHPPITVPAWRIMASGQDAGSQGVYGFRTRTGEGYGDIALTHSGMFQAPALWDRLGACGLRTTLIGVPGTWPPRPLAGKLVTGPLTPDGAAFTYPESLGARVDALTEGAYTFDIQDYRHVPPEELVAQVRRMTRTRARVTEALARDDDWNLLWSVEIGLDRLHHALWHHVDPAHPRYIAHSPLDEALLDYHRLLDEGIAALVEACDEGETAFLVVSDHGARPMEGGVLVNTWLIERGLLTLKAPLDEPTRFDPALIDWSRTRAWAVGGYCARVLLNLQGRQPQGIVAASEADALLAELKAGLEAIPGPDGAPLDNRAWRGDELYEVRRGHAPDLSVYFGDLGWRAIDTLGVEALHTEVNNTGPDAANHAWDGIFVAAGAGIEALGRVEGARLLDVAPTIEALLGVEGAL